LLIFRLYLQLFKFSIIRTIGEEIKMKRLVIACILILALTNQAYAMGWMGGKGGGGSSGKATSSGTSNSATNTTNNSPTNFVAAAGTEGQGLPGGFGITPIATSGTSNGATNTTNNSPTSLVAAGTEVQGSGGVVGIAPVPPNNSGIVSTPEPTTMFLLGSALFGLWGLRRKIKK
jgi:hypothetical protein